jgi:hypothetical protein
MLSLVNTILMRNALEMFQKELNIVSNEKKSVHIYWAFRSIQVSQHLVILFLVCINIMKATSKAFTFLKLYLNNLSEEWYYDDWFKASRTEIYYQHDVLFLSLQNRNADLHHYTLAYLFIEINWKVIQKLLVRSSGETLFSSDSETYGHLSHTAG